MSEATVPRSVPVLGDITKFLTVNLRECKKCGALVTVGAAKVHSEWHEEQGR